MKTIEQALRQIENDVSGRYMETFPESKLRKDTKGNIELLKMYLETISKARGMAVKKGALENILNIVLDEHPLPENWQKPGIVNSFDYCRNVGSEHRLIKYPYDLKKCVECCDEIITRLEEEEKTDDDTMSVAELNRKYEGKWLYFYGVESGCEWVYVKNIHRRQECPVLCVDGVMIDYDGQGSDFSIHPVENKNFADFYYFDSDDDEVYEGFTLCSSLDSSLMSRPIDTSLPTHVVESKDVVDDILTLFGWEFEHGHGTNVPGMQKLFLDIMYKKK